MVVFKNLRGHTFVVGCVLSAGKCVSYSGVVLKGRTITGVEYYFG